MPEKKLVVHKDEFGEEFVYMPSGGGPNDHVFSRVYLDDLGFDPREDDNND